MKNVLKPLAKNVNIAIINSISSRFRNPCKFFSSATLPSDYAHQIMWVIDIFSKYAWVVPLKYKSGIKITKTFQNVLNESGGKPDKI